MTRDRKMIWVCPVCGALFTDADLENAGSMCHCLDCDHHYPDEDGCHNCHVSSDRLIHAVRTSVPLDCALALCDWSKRHGYRRGVEELYEPSGRITIGGIPTRPAPLALLKEAVHRIAQMDKDEGRAFLAYPLLEQLRTIQVALMAGINGDLPSTADALVMIIRILRQQENTNAKDNSPT